MNYNWQDYLELAKWLKENGPSEFEEATLRSIVSRAYYSSFNLAKAYAKENLEYSRSPFSEGVHEHLRNHFKQKRKIKEFNHLDRLAQFRVKCDYYSTVDGLGASYAQSAINQAHNLISLLK